MQQCQFIKNDTEKQVVEGDFQKGRNICNAAVETMYKDQNSASKQTRGTYKEGKKIKKRMSL